MNALNPIPQEWIKVHICHLRKKLKPFGIGIKSRYGFGWRLVMPGEISR